MRQNLGFEFNTEGFGDVEEWAGRPEDVKRFAKANPEITCVRGDFGHIVYYDIQADGVSIHYSIYDIARPVILKARSDNSVLELRVALQSQIGGQWEGIEMPSLAEDYFCLSFTPFVKTRAEFNRVAIYATCDFHYDAAFLERMAKDFSVLDRFLAAVVKKDPIQVAGSQYRCPPLIKAAIHDIEHNLFSAASQKYIIENCAKEALLSALERISLDSAERGQKKFEFTPEIIDKLNKAKAIIERDKLEEVSLEALCRQCELNEFWLKRGFRALHKFAPIEYHIRLRMQHAEQMLRDTNESIERIGFEIRYESATAFIVEFKKHAHCTPSQFRKISRM